MAAVRQVAGNLVQAIVIAPSEAGACPQYGGQQAAAVTGLLGAAAEEHRCQAGEQDCHGGCKIGDQSDPRWGGTPHKPFDLRKCAHG
jgi:hypothetical protein